MPCERLTKPGPASDSGSMAKTGGRRFKVALSFPGERREFVEKVAAHLAKSLGRESVFYDQYFEGELARPDLDVYLGEIYGLQSELVTPFFSAEYDRKKWCQLEWRNIRVILFDLEPERIMPFRFDDTKISGFLKFDGYVPIGNRSAEQMADLILKRLSGQTMTDSDLVWESNSPAKEHDRLPSTSGLCLGRDDILNKLDKAWSSPTTNVCTLVASGGVGKSLSVKAWIDRLKKKEGHGARAKSTAIHFIIRVPSRDIKTNKKANQQGMNS